MRKISDLSDIEIKEIINMRSENIFIENILSKYNISYRQYNNILKISNIPKKTKANKYDFNEDYFEFIDTEDKAYFLGFILADGCVSKSSNCFKIIQKEPDILYKFKECINFNGPIFKSKYRSTHEISMSSMKTIKDLSSHGIYPAKTYIVKYPNIPDQLINHFMRGVFDGDGCISLRIDKRDNSKRGQVNICSGSFDFITEYYNKLLTYCDLSGKNKIRCPSGTYYVVDWGGLSDVEKIHKFFYNNATIYLDRKKKTFDEVISITKEKNKYRK